LEGSPRAFESAKRIDEFLSKENLGLNAVIELTVENMNTLVERASGRLVDISKGITYNTNNLQEGNLTPEEKSELSVRKEDNDLEAITKRVEYYNQNIQKVRDYFKEEGIYHTVNSDRTIDEIILEIMTILKSTQPKNRKPVEQREWYLYDPNLKNIVEPHTRASTILRVKSALCRLLKLDINNKVKFPGSHPSSFGKSLSFQIHEHPYVFSIKADGIRYLMFLSPHFQCLIDREMFIYKIKIAEPINFTTESILDGELIRDKKGSLMFLVFDGLVINNEIQLEEMFSDRFEKISNFINELPPNYFPFEIKPQTYFKIREIEHALNQITPQLKYHTDGIIFMPLKWHYKSGYNKPILKWKPPSLQTIDFLLQKEGEEFGLFVRHPDGLMKFSTINIESEEENVMYTNLLGKIIECNYDINAKKWIYLKTREDRSQPNGDWVAKGIWECIKENITKMDLIKFVLKLKQGKIGRIYDKDNGNRGGRGENKSGRGNKRGRGRGVQKYRLKS